MCVDAIGNVIPEIKTEIMMFISPAIIEATQCGECKDAKIINKKIY